MIVESVKKIKVLIDGIAIYVDSLVKFSNQLTYYKDDKLFQRRGTNV